MGVINVSPESRNRHTVAATRSRLGGWPQPRRSRADLIDLGAQSSHYEEATLTPEEEWRRLGPALRRSSRRSAGLGRHLEAGGGEACHR